MVVTCKPVKNFNILFFYRDKCFVHPFVDSWVLKLLSPFLIDRIVKRPRQKRRNLLPYSYFQLFSFHHYLMEFHSPNLDTQIFHLAAELLSILHLNGHQSGHIPGTSPTLNLPISSILSSWSQ